MGDLYIKKADGTVPKATDLVVRDFLGNKPVRVLYVLQSITQLTLDPPTYQYNWTKVREYEPPTEIPPAPALRGKDNALSTLDTECVPAQYSSPDVRFTYQRQISYELNGVADSLMNSISPSATRDIQTWTDGDQLRARVRFVNEAGAGPWGDYSGIHTVVV